MEVASVGAVAALCLSNDERVLQLNLKASPAIQAGDLPLYVAYEMESAAIGYNRLIKESRADICILVHQDVYLPEGWCEMLMARIEALQQVDPDWAVMAAYGVGPDGRHWGPVWSSSVSAILGGVSERPVPIQSADELLIVLRVDSDVRFDENLPHFHFHGLDIVQTALASGKGAYAMPLPLIHNDCFDKELAADYRSCYHYLRRKWRGRLPIAATTTTLSWHGLHLYRSLRRMQKYSPVGSARAAHTDVPPQHYAELCGWGAVYSPRVWKVSAGILGAGLGGSAKMEMI